MFAHVNCFTIVPVFYYHDGYRYAAPALLLVLYLFTPSEHPSLEKSFDTARLRDDERKWLQGTVQF